MPNPKIDELEDEKDTAPVESGVMPEEFVFDSKLIFISNHTEIPEDIEDCLAVQLNYSKDQVLTLIESKIEQLCPEYPELTLDDKQRVLAFMRKHKDRAKLLSFDLFIHICLLLKSKDPNWSKWALAQMN